MIDVANPAGTPTLGDFTFTAGTSANPATWSAAPAPSGMLVRPGGGVAGSTRIEFAWANGSLTNRWLQITTKSDAATGLASPDIFYFGNLIAFAGEPPVGGVYSVTSADQLAARLDLHSFLNPALITNAHDYSRDGRVDATDQIIAQLQITAGGSLMVLNTPAAPAFASAAPADFVTATDDTPTSTESATPTLDLSHLVDGEGVRPRRHIRKRLLTPTAPTSIDPSPITASLIQP